MFAVAMAMPASAQEFSCFPSKTCGRMRNCAEAYFHLTQCGDTARDGDGDGIPCEKLCGKSLETMAARLAAQGYPSPSAPSAAQPLADFSCEPRKSCGQMLTCDEAYYHLQQCGNSQLDGNGDGIPCNSLCRNR
ncbi:MAG: excalibur calcium-binding domain-containing protein [Nitratireductor sp.]|nr:excalibur calcium-binding domain-containing protein [Nitratireductor sp.]